MEALLGRARARAEERDAVAAEVRGAIAASGLTQAAFASRIGTSASRLSTYARGKVTPSAALPLRIRRRAQRQDATAAPAWPEPPTSGDDTPL